MKKFNELKPETRRVIDSALLVYLSLERAEIGEGNEPGNFTNLDKMHLVDNAGQSLPKRVANLREILAEDIQQKTPKHYNWRDSTAFVVNQAAEILGKQGMGYTAGEREEGVRMENTKIRDLIKELTDLPEPKNPRSRPGPSTVRYSDMPTMEDLEARGIGTPFMKR